MNNPNPPSWFPSPLQPQSGPPTLPQPGHFTSLDCPSSTGAFSSSLYLAAQVGVFGSISEIGAEAYSAAVRRVESVSLEVESAEGYVGGPHAPHADRGRKPRALRCNSHEGCGHQKSNGDDSADLFLESARARNGS
eukprot:CAMPEP_0167814910 /NCGR_PEP_ID=MMETSP0112_2-20121227/2709_1 /TAXON_ID=91324 /ORGANISM="Lotharella globosa, Strain CCCM811" /LENGTH=135 /DNA_ID=CAMNT_0007714231 /DNA_START=578 /DNA_END=980 /DNA_ORIENTATION=+